MIQVFYHFADLDGRCCGEIARRSLPANTEFVGIDYNQPFAFNPNATKIYCLDWVPQPWIDDPRIFVIDHHKTSLGRPGIVNTSCAACELAWGYFMGTKPMPRSVQLLGQYDSWRKGPTWETEVLPFQWGMRAEETRPGSHIWFQVFSDEIDSIIQSGKKILIYQEQVDRIRMARAFPLTFEGLRFIAVLGGPAGSVAFKSVWDPVKYDAMMVIEYGWKVSMYTEKPNIDLSAVAKKYGGGGHAGAAGFRPNNPEYFFVEHPAQKLDGKFHGVIVRDRDGTCIPPDRFMCFMAYDDALPATLAFYQDECGRIGAGPEQLAAVQRLRDRVAAWRSAHECLCKIPDAEPGECH